ncbi:sugar-binding domain-containing protein [Actinopolymorpha sp. B11F2]|uniref:sugar-binding domain-containing protein n=1 Tax=Actinopolymorpha sp. B11F2 TaxID=3160862 RepID=UPI0032E45808
MLRRFGPCTTVDLLGANWLELSYLISSLVNPNRPVCEDSWQISASVGRWGVVTARQGRYTMDGPDEIDLASRWKLRLDPGDSGITDRWWQTSWGYPPDQVEPDHIDLPGSLQSQGYGNEVTAQTDWVAHRGVERSTFPDWWTHPMYARYRTPGQVRFPYWLQPLRHFVGAAWYQREVAIPDAWHDLRVVLNLERCHWTSRVWVDGQEAETADSTGMADSLSTPHVYDLTGIAPGKHRITLRVDNRLAFGIGIDSSSVTDHTQTSWNGVVGRMALRATPPVWIDDIQIYPDADGARARFDVEIGNTTGRPATASLTVALGEAEAGEPPIRPVPVEVSATGKTRVTVELPVSSALLRWDEFQPVLHEAIVRLDVQADGRRLTSIWRSRIGLRTFASNKTQFTVNGRTAFLRGTVECCVFPRHGYPSTDIAEWRRVMATVRRYGLNHVRFHSWCPPEAAFQAADEEGIYLHVECPLWAIADDAGLLDYLRRESIRILRAYGNHPSFVMFGLGNESFVEETDLRHLLKTWKRDPRRLYTGPANDNPSLIDAYDFYIAVHLDGQRVRTQMGWPPKPFDSWSVALTPGTSTDYRAAVDTYPKPLLSHEAGQRCAYPDWDSVRAYDGSLGPAYLEIARDQLTARNMIDRAGDFVTASGAWQVEQYKEEIEAALRTPGFGGFQLLQLNDFPGQGTALVGVLDAFWNEKGYVTAQRWRSFCDATVPLARMPARVWTDSQTLEAPVDVAHFGPSPLAADCVRFEVRAAHGTLAASGKLAHSRIDACGLHRLGTVTVPLSDLACPAKYQLVVTVAGHANSWDFWIYPSRPATREGDVLIASHLDPDTVAKLEAGAHVLLLPHHPTAEGTQCFTSAYWNAPWTDGGETQTLGIIANPAHPALHAFPTDAHTNWHWHELLTYTQPLVLDGWGVTDPWPAGGDRPIVQVIDDWNTNRKLALIMEARVGRGTVLICAADLTTDLTRRVVARQLRYSLVRYLNSAACAPTTTVTRVQLQALLSRHAFQVAAP